MKDAFDAGKRFHVIVIDSRPKNEGILCNRYHRPAATRDRRQFPRWDMLLIILLLWLLFVLSYHLNFPGIHCLKQLLKHGVRCSYAQITSLAYLIKEACFYSYFNCRYFFSSFHWPSCFYWEILWIAWKWSFLSVSKTWL